jgi:hypothetical protein
MSVHTNPRYLAYCLAHGETDPEVMLERERERWPGGVMVGYSLWIQEQWREFPGAPWEHEAFDAWLAAKVAS